MTSTDVAGEGGTAPLPTMPDFKYRAVAGGAESPLFDTREQAREWQSTQREANPLAPLELHEVEV